MGVDLHIQKSMSYNWINQVYYFIKRLKGKKVIDLGCGGGRDIPLFLNKGIDITGIDYSKETIKRCKKLFPSVRFYKRDIRETKFKDKTFDGVWACASLLNLKKKDMPKTLLEIKRILKKEGIVFISVKEGNKERYVPDKISKRFFSFYKKEEISDFIKKAGFNIFNIEKVSDYKLTNKKARPKKPDWICICARN